jgi:ribosomal protein L11 methyltransferase
MTTSNFILKVTCPSHHADCVACVLIEAGSQGVEERDCTTMSKANESVSEIIAGFEGEESRVAAKQLLLSLPLMEDGVTMEDIDDIGDDWKIRWREFFSPQVLSILQIVTPWMSPQREDLIPIVIDPGQAFGTGGHATTRLILQMMERRAAAKQLPCRAADIGSGSGILSIAARKLGVKEVVGVDIEEEAVSAFFENAERNNVLDGIDCKLGTAADLDGTWPLVLANIQLDVFLLAAADIAAKVAPKGEILISGLLLEQVDACVALFKEFKVMERQDEGEWSAVALVRNS